MKSIRLIFSKRWFIILPFSISLFAFYCLNNYTGLAIDDFGFKFIKSFEVERTYCRVTSLSELVESQTNHYLAMNGRVFANGLAQLFLISENKTWFNLVNTVVFGFFQILILSLTGFRNNESSGFYYLLMITLLWFFTPGPNHTYLWLDGSLNYLWIMGLVLGFLWLHSKIIFIQKRVLWYWYPLLLLVGFIAGSGHEVISIGIAGSLVIYYLLHKKKLTGGILAMVTGFCLGTAFVVLAPGNMIRVDSEMVNESTVLLTLAQRIWTFVLSVPSMIALIILVTILLLIRIKNKSEYLEIIDKNYILLLSLPISLLFIITAGASEERVFFGVAVFSIIVLLSIFQQKKIFKVRSVRFLLIFFAIIMITEYIFVLSMLKENKSVFDNDEKLWRSSKENVFEFREKKYNRFVTGGLGEFDRYHWQNMVMSKYYEKEFMIFLPSELYHKMYLTDEIISSENLVAVGYTEDDSTKNKFFKLTESDFIAMPSSHILAAALGKGAYIKLTPTTPIETHEMDMRQKVTKLLYKTEPQPVTEETQLCFSVITAHGSYIYFRAPEKIPVNLLQEIDIYSDETSMNPKAKIKIQNTQTFK